MLLTEITNTVDTAVLAVYATRQGILELPVMTLNIREKFFQALVLNSLSAVLAGDV